jgi:hypothetical protein
MRLIVPLRFLVIPETEISMWQRPFEIRIARSGLGQTVDFVRQAGPQARRPGRRRPRAALRQARGAAAQDGGARRGGPRRGLQRRPAGSRWLRDPRPQRAGLARRRGPGSRSSGSASSPPGDRWRRRSSSGLTARRRSPGARQPRVVHPRPRDRPVAVWHVDRPSSRASSSSTRPDADDAVGASGREPCAIGAEEDDRHRGAARLLQEAAGSST